jgi:hypothetical protein
MTWYSLYLYWRKCHYRITGEPNYSVIAITGVEEMSFPAFAKKTTKTCQNSQSPS